MLKHSELLLRGLCAGLVALLLFQLSRAATRVNPLAGATIPPLPSLPETATNTPPAKGAPGPAGMPMMMGPGMPGRTPAPPLPAALQARVDLIVQKEILAPVIRPLPMALLGIVGDTAFLRAANGQTGLVKEGGEVGGLKLIRIGTNRVLVEEQGQQKELMIFSGYGGEPLLTQPTAKNP